MLVTLNGLSALVEFDDADEVLAILPRIMRGWRIAAAAADAPAPVIRVRRRVVGFVIEAPSLDEPLHEQTALAAACSLLVDLAAAFFAERPELLQLHCGAVEIGGRAVLFPSARRAGKSTLVSRLAAAGRMVHADDLIGLSGAGMVHALGFAPRLRLPVPAEAGAFAGFVVARSGPADERYLYLDLPPDRLAPLGRQAPLGAAILLERGEGVPARLERISAGQGLVHLISRHPGSQTAAADLLDRLHRIARALPCFRLSYSDLDEAAQCLEAAFADWNGPSAGIAADISPAMDMPSAPAAVPPDRRFRRNEAAQLREAAGEAFLVRPDGEEIYHLNTLGRGLWHVLAGPVSVREAAAAVSVAFPEIDGREIRCDMAALFAGLREFGLIAPAPCGAPGPKALRRRRKTA